MAYAQEDEDEFVRRVMENKTAVQRAEQEQAKRTLEKQERRINELDAIIQRLYEDHVMGKLNAERFAKLSEGYEKEQADLKQSVENLRRIVDAAETQAVNVQSFLKIVKKYTEPTELTPRKRQPHDALASCGCLPSGKLLYQGSPGGGPCFLPNGVVFCRVRRHCAKGGRLATSSERR